MNSGQVVKMLLTERGVLQTWLARNLGIKPTTLNMILNKDLQFELLYKICNILNIPLVDFITIYDKKNEASSATAKKPNLPQTDKNT